MLGRHAGFEGHPVGLGDVVAHAVLGEVQALLLLQRGAQIGRTSEQSGLPFLADAALEHRLDEYRPTLADERLDLVVGRRRTEDLGGGEPDELEQLRSVEHSGDLHGGQNAPRP